jgi:hypothetical protein
MLGAPCHVAPCIVTTPVPEGPPPISHRFSGGIGATSNAKVPEGRLKPKGQFRTYPRLCFSTKLRRDSIAGDQKAQLLPQRNCAEHNMGMILSRPSGTFRV